MRSFLHTLLMVTVGCFIYAVGLNMFYIPHNLLSGGINGVAVIIYYLTGISFGIANLVINIPMIILSVLYLGKRFTTITIYGTVMMSVAVDLLAPLAQTMYIHESVLSAVFGGILLGVGSGLMYRYDGNSGGLDVVAAIVKKKYSLEMGSVIFALNACIMAASAIIFNLELAVLTLAGMYTQSLVTNKVVIGLNQRKTAYIVSEHADEIADAIIREVGRGVTILYGEGAFTKGMRKVIFVVINLTQIAKIKKLLDEIDPHAFMFITPTADVMGRGFTSPKTPTIPQEAQYYHDEFGRLIRKKTLFPAEKHPVQIAPQATNVQEPSRMVPKEPPEE